MDWRTALLLAAAGSIYVNNKQTAPESKGYYKALWHHHFDTENAQSDTKAAFYNNTWKIFCTNIMVETPNLYTFSKPTILPPNIPKVNLLIYDENSGQAHNNLSVTGKYPALLLVSSRSAYSLNGKTWQKSCDKCIDFNISRQNSEVYLSHDKTFWVSFDDNNKIITSRDFRSWTLHEPSDSDKIRSIFPMLNCRSEAKWVLMYLVNVSIEYTYNTYVVGTITHEKGFTKEQGPFNLTAGQATLHTIAATTGDDITKFQYLVATTMNNVMNHSGPTAILNTVRKMYFKEISPNMEVIVQQPLLTGADIPMAFKYHFSNLLIDTNKNVLTAMHSLSFIMEAEFTLGNAQEVGVFVRRSSNGKQRAGIGYCSGVFYVGVDTKAEYSTEEGDSLILNRFARTYEAKQKPTVPSGNPVFLIYVDGALVEVFCDNNQVIFNLLLLADEQSDGMQIYASPNTTATLFNLVLTAYDK